MFNILVGLIGGLGMFLYGMKLMGDGLENATGEKLKGILEKVTGNKFMGVLVGAIVTAIIQSSSATTVMVVGFVNAGLMSLVQAAGVIMGANIGTTITAQMVSFKLEHVAPIFVAIGSFIILFSKNKKKKELASILLGFGLLFMGMGMMSVAMKPVTQSYAFQDIIVVIGANRFLGLLAGLGMTALVQSSSATTVILIALASTGAISLNVALPIILGSNIGTCVTALLSSIGTSKNARKAALIHLLFNVIGTLIFLPFINQLVQFVQYISSEGIERQVANAHTVFNIVATLVMLPLTKYLIVIVNKIIPGGDEEVEKGFHVDDRILETPVIAIPQVEKEIVRMANLAKSNLELAMDGFKSGSEESIDKIYKQEELINSLEREITRYLVKLSKIELSDKDKNVIASAFHVITDIERIGDHAENIIELAMEKNGKKISFSEDAISEVNHIYSYTLNSVDIAIESYTSKDSYKAEKINDIEDRIDKLEKELRENHIKRLNQGTCDAISGTIFLELIHNFERIGDHSNNIAQQVQ